MGLAFALFTSASAEAAQVIRYSETRVEVKESFDPDTGSSLELDIGARLRVEGFLDLGVPTPFPTPIPTRLLLDGRWRYESGGFSIPQPSSETKTCLGAQVLLPLFPFALSSCSLGNDHVFEGLTPDREVLVQHVTRAEIDAVGWSAIEISAEGEIQLIAGGSAGGTLVIEAEDILPPPREFVFSRVLKTQACPRHRPWWNQNAGICQACPQDMPLWVELTKSCEPCPPGEPFFDGEACTDIPPEACPDRMRWSEQDQECVCQSGYFSWRQVPTDPLECLTRDELVERLPDNPIRPLVLAMVDNHRGSVFVQFCRVDERFTTRERFDPQTGTVIVEATLSATLSCDYIELRYKNGGPTGPTRVGCHDGLGWLPCAEDPVPQTPLPFTPAIDLEEIFGPCHFVGSQQVTSCGDDDGPGSPMADLEIGQLQLENPSVQPGDRVGVRVWVRNSGAIAAPNSELWITWTAADGVPRLQRLWIGSLSPGQTRQLVAWSDRNIAQPLTAMAGNLTVSATADGTFAVAESSELNNQATTSVWVAPPAGGGANLRAAWITVEPEIPVTGSALLVRFAVDNVGDQPAAASFAHFLVTLPGGEQRTELWSVPALGAGEQWTAASGVLAGTAGTYSFLLRADHLDDVVEISEHDNSFGRQVYVSADSECLPCTSGQPNHVGAELCFDGPGGVPETGSQWRCQGVRFDGTSCVASGNHPNGWAWLADRCPPPESLCVNVMHEDRCGNPGVCPGTRICS